MLVSLQKIGNSRGIVIPKPLIEELHLDSEVELVMEHHTLVLRSPQKEARKGWGKASRRLSEQGDDALVWPGFSNDADKDLVW